MGELLNTAAGQNNVIFYTGKPLRLRRHMMMPEPPTIQPETYYVKTAMNTLQFRQVLGTNGKTIKSLIFTEDCLKANLKSFRMLTEDEIEAKLHEVYPEQDRSAAFGRYKWKQHDVLIRGYGTQCHVMLYIHNIPISAVGTNKKEDSWIKYKGASGHLVRIGASSKYLRPQYCLAHPLDKDHCDIYVRVPGHEITDTTKAAPVLTGWAAHMANLGNQKPTGSWFKATPKGKCKRPKSWEFPEGCDNIVSPTAKFCNMCAYSNNRRRLLQSSRSKRRLMDLRSPALERFSEASKRRAGAI